MREFGKECYKKTFYFSFDRKEGLKEIFQVSKEPLRILGNTGGQNPSR